MVARSAALFHLTRPLHRGGVVGAFTAILPPASRSCRTISNACWPTPPSASSATCSGPGRRGLLGAVFHLFTHAFFKPCSSSLRLGDSRHERRAGYAPHGRPQEQDPITHWTMFVASLAIAGSRASRGSFERRDPVAATVRRSAPTCCGSSESPRLA